MRRLQVGGVLLFLVGCSGVVDVPSGTVITCTAAEPCPQGWECNARIGRCIEVAGRDSEAPALAAAPSVTPKLLRAGAWAMVTFTVTEPLFFDPVVVLALPGGDRALELEPTASSGLTYAFRYTATGAEPQEAIDSPLRITLIDRSGNEAAGLAGGGLRFDFGAPQFARLRWTEPGPLSAGKRATLQFVASEVLPTPPSVALASGQQLTLDPGSVPPNYAFGYVAIGDESTAADGVGVTVRGTDAAGNSGSAEISEPLVFDFAPPSTIAGPTLNRSFAKAGELIEVTVTADEALDLALTTATLDGVPMIALPTAVSTYRFLYTVQAGDDGPSQLAIVLADRAGNTTPLNLPGPFIDTLPPAVTGVTLSSGPYRSPTGAQANVTIPIAFTLSEALDPSTSGQISVDVAGLPATCSGATATTSVNCSFTVPRDRTSPDALEGTKDVYVVLTDNGGNQVRTWLGPVELDFRYPGLAASPPTLELLPAATNPLTRAQITRVALGTAVRVEFQSDEPVGVIPVVRGRLGASTLQPFTAVSASVNSTSFVYELLLSGAPVQGGYVVEAVLTDRAGNAATRALGLSFVVDTVAPPALSAAQNDGILYRRYPWGDSAGGGPRSEVQGAALGAVEASSFVAIFSSLGSEIARSQALADGRFAVPLDAADRRDVYLRQIDLAGNWDLAPAPGARLLTVEWTANLGGKVPGSPYENPNHGVAQSVAGARSAPGVSLGASDGVAALGGQMAPLAPTAHFLPRKVAAPPDRHWTQMVYDANRDRTVYFGGTAKDQFEVDFTREHDGTNWQLVTPTDPEGDGNPAPRYAHAMLFDSRRGLAVLFGGRSGGGTFNELWGWDGSSWRLITPATSTVPSGRSELGFAYDSRRDRYVLYGGLTGGAGTQSGETWEFDPDLQIWTRVLLSSPPGARSGLSLTFDPDRNETLLFGGIGPSGVASPTTTWRWNGGTWLDATPTSGLPAPQGSHAAVWDSTRRRVFLLGGGVSGSEAWEWNGLTWTNVSVAQMLQPARVRHAMAYDSNRQRVLVHAGSDAGASNRDTWSWDGVVWRELTGPYLTVNSPQPLAGASIAYDSARKQFVLFGGDRFDMGYADTWEYTSEDTWFDVDAFISDVAGDGNPSGRAFAAMAYDPSRGVTVLFGGSDGIAFGDTWEYVNSGSSRVWNRKAPTVSPGARTRMPMVYDASRLRTVIFGGHNGASFYSDLYEFSGATWTARNPATRPAARARHGMAYDSARARIVLFGGRVGNTLPADLRGDTWEWNGATGVWALITPTDPEGDGNPSPREDATMFYDAARRRTILIAGFDGTALKGDIWEWNGTSWRELTRPTLVGTPLLYLSDPYQVGRPSPRRKLAAAYDSNDDRALMFGGELIPTNRDDDTANDTWVWRGGGRERMAHVFELSLRDSQADGPAGRADLQQIVATFAGGGQVYPAGAALNGVKLQLFEENAWRDLMIDTLATSAAPRTLTYTFPLGTYPTPAAYRRLFYGPKELLTLALTPRGVNGLSDSRLHLDYAEVRIRFKMK